MVYTIRGLDAFQKSCIIFTLDKKKIASALEGLSGDSHLLDGGNADDDDVLLGWLPKLSKFAKPPPGGATGNKQQTNWEKYPMRINMTTMQAPI